MESRRTTAVQIEGLTKDMQYIKQQIEAGFRITHEKQDKTNGRVLKLEENQVKLLPKEEFETYKKEKYKGDSQIETQKIISKKEITIAILSSVVTLISGAIGLKMSGLI